MVSSINYQLEDIINLPNLFSSFYDCLSGVMWKDRVVHAYCFDDYFVNNAYNSFYNTNWGYYFPDTLNHTIINERGKERLICSNSLRDRLVSKCFNQHFLLPVFVPRLIYDNCASLQGKGVDFALDRFENFLHSAYINFGTNFYVLKLDVRHYFDSIYHPYIMGLISNFTTDQRVLQYFRNQFCQFQNDPFINGGALDPQGVGLGSECDQSFGIICLNEMDHMIKEKFHIKGYVRYMYDAVLISDSKEQLIEIFNYLQEYLNNVLHMKFNQNKSYIVHISQGVLFLKVHYYVLNTGKIYRKLYKPTIKRFKRKLRSLAEMLNSGEILYTDVNTSYYSTLGTLMRSDCKDQIKAVSDLYDYLFIEDWLNKAIDPETGLVIL